MPVIQEDTVETLHQRIHAAEYRLYPRAVDLFCRGKIIVEEGDAGSLTEFKRALISVSTKRCS